MQESGRLQAEAWEAEQAENRDREAFRQWVAVSVLREWSRGHDPVALGLLPWARLHAPEEYIELYSIRRRRKR